MKEREYKCGYRHCLKPDEKIPASEVVMVGKSRYHKECAELRAQIDRIKRIYFDYIDDKCDYIQVAGVINNLIFKKGYDVDFVEFMMKYAVVYCQYNIRSPYILHIIIKNGIVEEKYKNEYLKKGVEQRFDNRFRKSYGSKRKTR